MKKHEFYANARTDLSGPLQGVTVVEATTTWAGPMAGCVLADFGARVIKVEHPQGEVARRLPPALPHSTLTVLHETVNRSKENVSIDLQHDQGRKAFLRLCQSADIVIENFRPGTLARWGVGYADVAEVKPDIVYVSISGFGQFGALSDRVGYDPVAQNYCGWAALNGEPDGGPMKAPTFLGDDLGGLHGALGAMAALRHRDQTGEGQHVDVALVDSLLFQSNGNPTSGALDIPTQRWGNQFGLAVPVNVYECIDGRIFGGVLLDTHWVVLARFLERDDLAKVPLAERLQRREEFDGVLKAYCAVRSTSEVVDTFAELGLPAVRVNTFADVAKETHVADRDMLQPTTLADGNQVPLTGCAAKFSRTPTQIRARAATLGEHNDSVLGSLGYSAEDIALLKAEGAL